MLTVENTKALIPNSKAKTMDPKPPKTKKIILARSVRLRLAEKDDIKVFAKGTVLELIEPEANALISCNKAEFYNGPLKHGESVKPENEPKK
jgi:hypothetical protein